MVKSTVFWHDTETVSVARPVIGDKDCDICIVGAGYTGLWTAYFLQQKAPSARIAVVESRFAGSGASGHNDGFLLQALAGQSGRDLRDKFGREGMLRVFHALKQSAIEISRFCVSKDLDVEFEASGIYSVATSANQQRGIIDAVRMAEQLGVPGPELLSNNDLHDVFGSAKVIAGYRVSGGLINPFKLTRALARIVVDNGADLYETTPSTGISETAAKACVGTETGRFFCSKVVLATDAFQSWVPRLSKAMFCVRSYILVSERLTMEQLERLNWLHRPGLITTVNPGVFVRLTWDNRILLGGGFTMPAEQAEDSASPAEQGYAERRLTRQFRHLFPALCDVRPEYVYGGIIGVTHDRLPRIGRLSPRISYAYGYCGHGIVSTHVVAKVLRDLTLEAGSDAFDLPFVPPTLRNSVTSPALR